GYCFSLASGTDQICQVYWGAEHRFKTLKTPTCISFNQKQEFKYFGYDAVMRYKSLPSSQADSWYFFQNFKMQLYRLQHVTLGLCFVEWHNWHGAEASNGKLLPAFRIFSESLCYLKEHALNTIKEASFQTVYDQEEITWVITVPAICSTAAKPFMHLAAKEVKAGVTPFPQITFGGIISDMLSENLIIALEPEAALLWCKQL
ncbi:HS12B protein, partial [Pardalotus punctatus]|nr:HS12B protein [Pardalotus punctatus]